MINQKEEHRLGQHMNDLAHQKTIQECAMRGDFEHKEADAEFREMCDWIDWKCREGVYRVLNQS